MRNRKPSLRASFVVTVTAIGSMAGGGCADTVGPGTMRADGCPQETPRSGDACGQEGQFCGYGVCTATMNTLASRVCRGGRWADGIATCNPPGWADAGPLPCPVSPPADGTSCPANAPLNCMWGGCDINAGLDYRTGGCSGGSWHIYISSCNPPPPSDAGAD